MQKLNPKNIFFERNIQKKWRDGLLPSIYGIVIGDGSIINIKEVYEKPFPKIFPSKTREMLSFYENEADFFSPTKMGHAFNHKHGFQAICGEGDMGNEGFVALQIFDDLIWSAVFCTSNPFRSVKFQDNFIIAESEYNLCWEFDIFQPWRINIHQM